MAHEQNEDGSDHKSTEYQQSIISWLNVQRPGTKLRIHLDDLLVAVPEKNIEKLIEEGKTGTQLVDISKMNNWLKDENYRLKAIEVEHDEFGSWAIVERRINV